MNWQWRLNPYDKSVIGEVLTDRQPRFGLNLPLIDPSTPPLNPVALGRCHPRTTLRPRPGPRGNSDEDDVHGDTQRGLEAGHSDEEKKKSGSTDRLTKCISDTEVSSAGHGHLTDMILSVVRISVLDCDG